jgi:hypothetical protein
VVESQLGLEFLILLFDRPSLMASATNAQRRCGGK